MINTNVNYFIKVNNPLTSSVVFPVKYFEIPIVNVNFLLKYSPYSQYPSLLMADYYLAKKQSKKSVETVDFLITAIKEKFAENEIIIMADDTQKESFTNGLISFKRLNYSKGTSTDETLFSEVGDNNDFEVLDTFHVAWQNAQKADVLKNNIVANRVIEHMGKVHQSSLPFTRSIEHNLELVTSLEVTREVTKKLQLGKLGLGLREYTHSMEIAHVLGSSKELTRQAYLTFLESSVRKDTKDLELHNSFKSERVSSFNLTKSFGFNSTRDSVKEGNISWGSAMERINEAGLVIKQTIYLSERAKEKGLINSNVITVERDRLKEFVVEQSLDMGKLKAREYPFLVALLINSNRDIEHNLDLSVVLNSYREQLKNFTVENVIDSVRDIHNKKMTLQHPIRALRSISHDLHLEDYTVEGQRHILKDMLVLPKLIESIRDISSDMSILSKLYRSEREISKNLDINRGMLKSIRNNSHNLYKQDSLIKSVREISKDMYLPQRLFESGKNTERVMSILGNNEYKRDSVSGLYLSQEIDSKRVSEKGLVLGDSSLGQRDSTHPFEVSQSSGLTRDNQKPTLIHQLTPADREHIKDLLLGFIGDYVRNNIKDMVINFPSKTISGGTIGHSTLPAFLMEDEIVGELVKDFGDIIESIVVGENERPLKGQLLSEKIIGAKKRLETFFENGIIQSSGPNKIALFNTDVFIGGTDRAGDFLKDNNLIGSTDKHGSNVNYLADNELIGQRPLPEGILEDGMSIGQRPLPEGTFEDEMALGYFNANPADFLSAEELASLGLDSGTVPEQEELIGYVEDRLGIVGIEILAENKKLGIVESEILAENKKLGIVESEILAENKKLGIVENGVLAHRITHHGRVETTNYLGENPLKAGVISEQLNIGQLVEYQGIENSDHWIGERLDQKGHVENKLYWGIRQDSKAVITEDIPQGSLLEHYGVTTDNLLEAEKLKWVGILTNILLEADEEKAVGYVEYLQQAGVLNADHYHLLNGLVGDLAEHKSTLYGDELVSDLAEVKADLIENLQGQGLIYDYKDFPTVLEKGMDIEEWDLDLGYGLPEHYEPDDPYNYFYPGVLDNYNISSLSLQQLESWSSFGGDNWEVDAEHGQLRTVSDNELPNGYIVNYYNSNDYVFAVNFKVDIDADGNDGVGVVFKYVNENNYYKFVISGGPTNSIRMGSNFMQLYKISNGTQQPIGSSMSPDYWDKGIWYNIRVSYVKKHIQIWVNDRLQYDLIDY